MSMLWEDTFIFPFVGHERVAWIHFNGGNKSWGEKNPEMKKPETSSWRTEPAPKECGVKADSLCHPVEHLHRPVQMHNLSCLRRPTGERHR